jgi:ribulose-phosphate 3-epimerase
MPIHPDLAMDSRYDRAELISRLRAKSPAMFASILFCDFGELDRELQALEAAGVTAMHLDVMDGNFVPNISFGLPIVEAARRATKLPIDVHLMIAEPARYIDQFRAAGADSMTIHVEAVEDPRPVLERIRELGAMASLAINPPTPLSAIEASLPYCDMVLVMSVMPGFGGQKFDEVALTKLKTLQSRTDVDPLLEVDGGITTDTIGPCADAGANLFVAGSAIIHSDDYARATSDLRSAALSALDARKKSI